MHSLLVLRKVERGMDDGRPGQGDGAESSRVGPGQRQEDVISWVAILGDDDPVEGDQVDGEDGADSPGQGGEGVSLVAGVQTSVAVECFVQIVAVDSELGKRDNMEDDDEPGITLVAVNRGEKEELLT